MMNKFKWRGMQDPGIFYDENYLRFPANARDKYYRLTKALMDKGDTVRAKKVVDHVFAVMPDKAIPYDYYTPQFIEPLVRLGDQQRANEVIDTMSKRCDEALTYYLGKGIPNEMEIQTNLFTLNQLMNSTRQLGMTEKAKQMEEIFMKHYSRVQQ